MNYISLSRNFLPLQGKIFRDKFLCYERLIFSSVLEIIIIQNLCQIVLIFSETLFKCSKEYLNYLSRWRCSDQSTHRHMFTITMEAAMFYLLDKSYTQLDFRVSVKSIPGEFPLFVRDGFFFFVVLQQFSQTPCRIWSPHFVNEKLFYIFFIVHLFQCVLLCSRKKQ